MAIIPGKQKTKFSFVDAKLRKQKKLLYLTAVVILATVGLYIVYIRGIDILPSPAAPANNSSNVGGDLTSRIIEMLKPMSPDLYLSLLKDKKFQSLILPGDFPIIPGEKGRTDPFAPINQ
jgi:hypothetical protein